MSLYLEISYAKQVGSRLDRFKIKKESPFAANSRCPICGDSAKSVTKARFHILQKESRLICYCFNCGYSVGFPNFIKTYHHDLYSGYVFEKYRSETTESVINKPTIEDIALIPHKTSQNQLVKLDLPLVSTLDKNHTAAVYVDSRHLPDYPFMYAEKFFEFSAKFNQDLEKYSRDEPRLIIPFFDRKGSVFAYQGRDLSGKSNQKYITITIDEKTPKIFGIDRVDFKKDIILVEGPIDSLFLSNSLAAVNASLVSTARKLTSSLNKNQLTLVYDCEPRNKVIVNMYEEAIKEGYKIVIWPKDQTEKDINDIFLSGKDPSKIIKKNTYYGLSAQLAFQQWKKV